jgi:hypothetical protein
LSPDALQCWFHAGRGRWRTLSRVSAHGALVVEAEAADLLEPGCERNRAEVRDGRSRPVSRSLGLCPARVRRR